MNRIGFDFKKSIRLCINSMNLHDQNRVTSFKKLEEKNKYLSSKTKINFLNIHSEKRDTQLSGLDEISIDTNGYLL